MQLSVGGNSAAPQASPPGPSLSPSQQTAIDALLPAIDKRQLCSLIGPAGAGKSFVLAHLLSLLIADGERCLIATPTHKASAVCRRFLAGAEVAGVRVTTVASLLKAKPHLDEEGQIRFASATASTAANALRSERLGLICIDEASMLASSTAQGLWNLAQALGSGLLFVGDRAQLPPVSDGVLAPLFLNPPGVRAELTEVRRNCGAVLELATALRAAAHPRDVWPTSSSPASQGGSRVVLYDWQNQWMAAAARAICTPAWDADPDSARVVAWANRTAAWIGQVLREKRFGTAAARQWQVGEILIAPSGIPAEGAALGNPQASACSEFRIIELGTPQALELALGSYKWKTPARGLERELVVAASSTAQRAKLQNIATNERLEAWLEPPAGIADPWASQIKNIRNDIRAHLTGGAKKKALKEIADLESMVPVLRQAAALTVHSSQGSTFKAVFVADDLRRCEGPEARALSYVAASRASEVLNLLPMPRPVVAAAQALVA